MSKIGAFVLDVQTAVEENFNEPLDICKKKVYESFISQGRPEWEAEYAADTAEGYYQEIVNDFDEFSYLMASEALNKHI